MSIPPNNDPHEDFSLTLPAKDEMLPWKAIAYLAFNTLESALVPNQESHVPQLLSDTSTLPQKTALFVTWTKDGRLRGCIGTFTELDLKRGIVEYAKTAALQDPRFKPIKKGELSHLSVDITLLGKMVRCKDNLDWTLGVHGVMRIYGDKTSATFLPSVPEEQGWSKEETLLFLAEKAGTGNPSSGTLYKYTGTKVDMSYEEYRAYRSLE